MLDFVVSGSAYSLVGCLVIFVVSEFAFRQKENTTRMNVGIRALTGAALSLMILLFASMLQIIL